jgi:hypothetical protein
MADQEELTRLQMDGEQQDITPEASTSTSQDSAGPSSSSIQAPPAQTDDPATSEQPLQPPQPSTRSKRWPAYFFPALAAQRTSFCLEILKREDIKSVRAFHILIVARSFQADLMRVSDITDFYSSILYTLGLLIRSANLDADKELY